MSTLLTPAQIAAIFEAFQRANQNFVALSDAESISRSRNTAYKYHYCGADYGNQDVNVRLEAHLSGNRIEYVIIDDPLNDHARGPVGLQQHVTAAIRAHNGRKCTRCLGTGYVGNFETDTPTVCDLCAGFGRRTAK